MSTLKFKTIGQGQPGPKTRALRADAKAITDSKLLFPDHVAFTAQFFERFLHELRTRGKAEFTPQEKAQIKEAIMSFPGNLSSNVFVRSDEYPRGVGLWHSGIVSGASLASNDDHIDAIGLEIQKVLESDNHPDVRAFRKAKNLSEPPGVLLMPVYGGLYQFDRSKIIHYLFPLVSANYHGTPEQKGRGAVGCGIGGANKKHAKRGGGMGAEFIGLLSDPMRYDDWNALDLETGEVKCLDISVQLREARVTEDQIWHNLTDRTDTFIESVGESRYVEVVLSKRLDQDPTAWMVVQSAPTTLPFVDQPDVPEESVKLESYNRVIVTKNIKASKIRFAKGNDTPAKEDEQFNEQNKGHVLVIDIQVPDMLGMLWGVRHVSNAKAIVLHVPDRTSYSPFISHLGGWVRELDIPVIAGKLDPDLLKSLRKQPEQKLNCLVHSDEWRGRGFLAIE